MSKPMWTCPDCGRRFAQRTPEHTCAVFSLESHLAGKPAAVAGLCRSYLDLVERLGEARIEPLRGMIMLRARSNFGSVQVQQSGLRCSLMLGAVPDSPRILSHAPYSGRRQSCNFRIDAPAAFDQELNAWLREAYALAQTG